MAFAFVGVVIAAIASFNWQLYTLSPGRSCVDLISGVNAVSEMKFEPSAECFTIMLRVLGMKNTGILISGITQGVLSTLMAVALFGVAFKGSGFGGSFEANPQDD